MVAARSRGAGEVDGAGGIGDEAGAAAVAVGRELSERAVAGYGRAARGASVGKREREETVASNGRISGRARVGKRYRAIVSETRRGRGTVDNARAIDFEERQIDGEGIRRRDGRELNRANRGGI